MFRHSFWFRCLCLSLLFRAGYSFADELPFVSIQPIPRDSVKLGPFQLLYTTVSDSGESNYYAYTQNATFMQSMNAFAWPEFTSDSLKLQAQFCCEEGGIKPLRDYVIHKDFILSPQQSLMVKFDKNWVKLNLIPKPGFFDLRTDDSSKFALYYNRKWYKQQLPRLLLTPSTGTMHLLVYQDQRIPRYFNIDRDPTIQKVVIQLKPYPDFCSKTDASIHQLSFNALTDTAQIFAEMKRIDSSVSAKGQIKSDLMKMIQSVHQIPNPKAMKDPLWAAVLDSLASRELQNNTCINRLDRDLIKLSDTKENLISWLRVIEYKNREKARVDSVTSIDMAARQTVFNKPIVSLRGNIATLLPEEAFQVQPSRIRGVELGLSYCFEIPLGICLGPNVGANFTAWRYDDEISRTSSALDIHAGGSLKTPILFRPGSFLGSILIGGMEFYGSYLKTSIAKPQKSEKSEVTPGLGLFFELYHYRLPIGMELGYQYNLENYGRIYGGFNFTMRSSR